MDIDKKLLDLSGKNVLLIGPKFYNYHNKIANAIKEYGAEVDFIPEKEYGLIFNILRYLAKPLTRPYSNSKLKKRLNNLKNTRKKIDHILIIHGEFITPSIMADLKQTYPAAKFLNYHWDSFKHNPNAYTILKYFDRVFSFDRVDAETIPDIIYKPLFHTVTAIKQNSSTKADNDLVFIGVDYSDRFKVIQAIKKEATHLGYSFKSLLVTSKFSFYRKKIFKRNTYKTAAKEDFHFGVVPYEEFLHVTNNANAVLDINFEGQIGLTMRTIEVLAGGKKLITTNPYIAKEPFYDEKMIAIIDRADPKIDPSFFQVKYSPINMNEFLLSHWVREFFL